VAARRLLEQLEQGTPEAPEKPSLPWRSTARPEQLAPGSAGALLARDDWSFWLLLAGRGFGKTRSGAEWAIEQARNLPCSHGALVGPTAGDVSKVMLSAGLEGSDGASGILAVSPPDFRPLYTATRRRLTWPNGTVATLYSAEEPNRLRGPQHHWGWVDELAAWEKEDEAWNQLLFGMRLGRHPRICITTTPRPIRILRTMLADPLTVVTKGRTIDNRANLAPSFLSQLMQRYEGTRLGRQELDAELLEDFEGALWSRKMIDDRRIAIVPALARSVVAIDPAVSEGEGSDETGIIVAGVGWCSCRGSDELHGFVLEDRSGKHSPDTWAREAVMAYERNSADRIVAEVNNGGALVEANLRTVGLEVAYLGVHAAQAKRTRAEPVAALYEQGKVHHIGSLVGLEDQLCSWNPLAKGNSPDRLDALVWALTELMLVPLTYAGTLSETADWMDDR